LKEKTFMATLEFIDAVFQYTKGIRRLPDTQWAWFGLCQTVAMGGYTYLSDYMEERSVWSPLEGHEGLPLFEDEPIETPSAMEAVASSLRQASTAMSWTVSSVPAYQDAPIDYPVDSTRISRYSASDVAQVAMVEVEPRTRWRYDS
jgi:hypothetical protein